MAIFFFVLLLLLATTATALPFSCQNQQNQPVDWFIAYKLPHLPKSPHPNVAAGTGFLYADVTNKQWQLSSVGLDKNNQAVAYTLQQFYDRYSDPTIFHLMYNDEHPPKDGPWTATLGHTKGVLFFNEVQGVWLVHSVPKFPLNTTYNWPDNAHVYGQSFLCITFPYSQLRNIATQLYFNTPYIYSAALPASISQQIPRLSLVLAGQSPTSAPFSSQIALQSSSGQSFISFAKAGPYNHDLYYSLVAPALHASLNTETWQHPPGNLYSWCYTSSVYQVHNVRSISLPFGINFTNYYDHSKFAVSTWRDGQTPVRWVCLGDINRQEHQEVRGGGTLCMQDTAVWTLYSNAVAETYPCTPNNTLF